MIDRIIYIVQFTYVDFESTLNNDYRVFSYNSYDEALEKIQQYKRIELEACELDNRGYDILADYDNVFEIYMHNNTMTDVRIHIQSLDKQTRKEKKLGKEIGVYEKLK